MSAKIPHATEPLLDGGGRLSRSWFTYLSSLSASEASAALQEQIDRLWQELRNLPPSGLPISTQIVGSEAIDIEGTLAAGRVVVKLKELEDAGGGELLKLVRDQYGRVAGTSSAAISDLRDVDASAASAGQVLTKQSDGNWRGQSPSGGGGGAMTFIGDVITTGSQSIVSFAGISNGYRNLVVHYRARGTAAASSVTIRARFNGDTGNNYAFYKRNRFGNVQSDNVGYIEFADIAAATAAAGTSDSGCMNVADYRGTTFFKTSSSIGTTYAGAGPGALTDFTGGGWWKNTAAIDAIDIFPASGAFVDGSVFSLYALQ